MRMISHAAVLARLVRLWLLFASLAFGAVSLTALDTGSEDACPVTRTADQQFKDGSFRLGTPDLWTLVTTHWKPGSPGQRLAYFSENFFYMQGDSRLAVVARRLDAPAPLIWSDWAIGAGPSYRYRDGPPPRDPNDHGFMLTRLTVPTAGCWEITARYAPARDKVQILAYTVWVEP
jgi:hypothetical protein